MKNKKKLALTEQISLFVDTHYNFIIIAILVLSFFLRIYNIQNKISLSDDTARDISIAKQAIIRHELPLIGSFSSAGPFVFGPLFYWYIIGCFLVFNNILTPFVILAFIGVLTVFVMSHIGKLLESKYLGIIIALLAATAPQLIIRSTMLGQHSFIAICTALTILFYILLWQKRHYYYAFVMGLFIGIGISMHYQALNLLIFFPALFLIPTSWKRKFFAVCLALIGVLIPSLPLLIWDAQQNFANIRNILDYFLVAQYRIYVPNSWRLFLFTYFPSYMSFVSGGVPIICIILFFGSVVFFVREAVQKQKNILLLTIAVIYLLLVFLNKFYRGERSESYLIYFAPFIILFTGWLIIKITEQIKNTKKSNENLLIIIPVFITLVLLGSNLHKLFESNPYHNGQIVETRNLANELVQIMPNKQFTIYDYKWKTGFISQSLSTILSDENKTSESTQAIKIGICRFYCPNIPVVVNNGSYKLYNLDYYKNFKKQAQNWKEVNPEVMYDDLIVYWHKHKLTSSFSLDKYIVSKLFH